MPNVMKGTEKALHKQTNKIFIGATKRYKRFMRQAAKAASDHKREQYMAAALGALVVTGVVASKLMARIERNKPPVSSAKKIKKKAKL
jgi:hypothetical protein